jgi:hypothetical protein
VRRGDLGEDVEGYRTDGGEVCECETDDTCYLAVDWTFPISCHVKDADQGEEEENDRETKEGGASSTSATDEEP